MFKRKFVAPSVVVVMIVLGGVLITRANSASAQAINQPSDQQQNQQNSQSNNQQSDSYTYTAQPGDSYSKMARKAVQTFGLKNKVNLSEAQIMFAETNLTKEANSPLLEKGQTVEIKEEAVKGWVDKAKELSAEKQAAWQKYTVGVDFNTNRVGQAS
jgi:hypothetical protein